MNIDSRGKQPSVYRGESCQTISLLAFKIAAKKNLLLIQALKEAGCTEVILAISYRAEVRQFVDGLTRIVQLMLVTQALNLL